MLSVKYQPGAYIVIGSAWLLWIYANINGLGLTDDSYYYLELASGENFGKAQHLLSFILSKFSSPPELTSLFLQGFLLLSVYGTWAVIISRFDWPESHKLLLLAFIVFGIPHFLISSFIWTELLFVFFLTLIFWTYASSLPDLFKHAIVGLLIVFLCWSRKIGLIFFIPWSLVIFFQRVSDVRFRLIMIISLLMGVFVLWFHFYPGEKPNSDWILVNLENNGLSITHWLIPLSSPLLVKLVLCAGIIYHFFIKTNKATQDEFFQIAFLFYFVIRLFAERPYPEEADRYLTIFYAPVIAIAGASFNQLWTKFKWPKLILLFMMILFSLNLFRTIRQSHRWNKQRSEIPAHRLFELP